ncbi:MAG: hypothetical protein IT381_12340 [Deltaproteobacteria bacterium]|nr:hypothetical protein [Deltaproteobacteria bacterium]
MKLLPPGYNDWAFISQSPLNGWVLAVAAVVTLAIVTMSVLAYLRAGRRYLVLGALHVVAALSVLIVVVQPALDLRAVTRIPGRIAFVIDDSQSMAENDGLPKSRAERVNQWLAEHQAELDALKGQNPIEYYTLSGPGRATRAQGPESDLLQALRPPLSSNDKARPLSAVVLVSDGADTEALGQAATAAERKKLAERLAAADVPVNTITVGGKRSADLYISGVIQDPIAFVRNTVKVEVRVEQKGLGAVTVPVSLKREGSLVTQQTARVPESGAAKVQFEIVPAEVGEFVFTVEVPVQPDEAVVENNKREFIVKVVRDKIRALLVSGRPSWDERFLRRSLKLSPNVDLISFFILRTPSDFQPVPQNESSLIPFPTHELFETELHTFDVVVLQNFDYRPYNMAYLLKNLREHVLNKGGALAMFGGESSFGGGAYAQTPLADVLPVEMAAAEMDSRDFQPVLTTAGEKHPVLRLQAASTSRSKAIAALPKLSGVMKVDGLAPGGTALLVHPDLKARDGSPMPVLAVREVGKGRTLAVTTDTLWRWSFADKMRGESGQAYERLIAQMFRWLMRDPEASRLRLVASRDRVRVGESVDYSVRVLGADYQPLPKAPVTLTISEHSRPDTVTSGETAEDGTYSYSYTVQHGGVVRAKAEARLEDDPLEATLLVYGDDADKERAALGSRDDVMGAIADATGGVAQSLDRADPSAWARAKATTTNVDRHQEIALWNTWAALLVVVSVLAVEWWLRRRWGFV